MRPVFIPDPPNLALIIFFDYRLYSDKDFLLINFANIFRTLDRI
jgi:hypothetical protein